MCPQVLAAEVADITESRKKRGLKAAARDLERRACAGDTSLKPSVDLGLVGMALSGGGIRSATFSLGVLQALNKLGVLNYVDYLSTVSGGGYTGSLWSCLLQTSTVKGDARSPTQEQTTGKLADQPDFTHIGPLFPLDHELGTEESAAMQRLRNYANYLRLHGIRAIRYPGLVLRGLLVNLLMILPYLLIASAATVMIWEEEIWAGTLGFQDLFLARFGIPVYAWAIVGWMLFLVGSMVCQSLKRRSGVSDSHVRQRVLAINSYALLGAVAVVYLDLQPLVIHWMLTSRMPSAESVAVSADWTPEIVLGTLLAVALATSVGAARSTNRFVRFGLVVVGLLIPATLGFVYLALCAFAVEQLPSAQHLFLLSFSTHEVWVSLVLNHLEWLYVFAAVILMIFSWQFFDVNATSLHNYYRDSLSKTFLFSVHKRRKSDGTFEENGDIVWEDGIRLTQLDIRANGGPYHLINAVVNNPDLENVNLRGRRSELFLFSRNYTGNNRLGYCPTDALESLDPSAGLGTAMAVSAAAAAPNMGQKSSGVLTSILLAVLNVRLGYWLPSPEVVNRLDLSGTRLVGALKQSKPIGPLYFTLEALGLPRFIRSRYVNLSDGGHLENLGVFELLRRRCEYIIAIDGESDSTMTFNGLANLIRLARTDLGIDIDIELDDLRKDPAGLSRRHWVLGKIRYSEHETGELLYIKSSLIGSENEYITEYRSRNPLFPHQSTVDQFFNEEQFEAYRALGYEVGRSILGKSTLNLADSNGDTLFDVLRQNDGSSRLVHETFLELTDRRREIERKLSERDMSAYASELIDLSDDRAVRSQPTPETVCEMNYQAYQLVNEQMQLMEAALFGLRLYDRKARERKSNTGWMNLFRRWSQSPTFQRVWATSIANYGAGFRQFCRDEFDLEMRASWRSVHESHLTPPERAMFLNPDDGTSDLWMARLFVKRRDESQGGFAVGVATVDHTGGRRALNGFRVRDTYRSIGLTRLLLHALKEDEAIWNGTGPAFRKPGKESKMNRIKRILVHLGYDEVDAQAGQAAHSRHASRQEVGIISDNPQ